MSTSVGTLKPKIHLGRPFIVAAVFAVLAAATIGAYTVTTGTDEATSTTTSEAATTPRETGSVITSVTTSTVPRAKQLGVEAIAGIASAPDARLVAARNAMLGSYQPASGVAFVEARNAMLGSYLQPSSDEIVVNGEICQICWKYR